MDYREGKRKARRVGEDVHLRGPDGKPASAPLLPRRCLGTRASPCLRARQRPIRVHIGGSGALSSSAPVPVGTKFKKRFRVWRLTCTIAAIQEDGTYLGAYEDGTVKAYTANEIAKY